MGEIENSQVAAAWFIVGLINEHFPHPEDAWDETDRLGDACHMDKCGPCSALNWFSANAPKMLNGYVRLTGYHVGGWAYWDDDANSLRWSWFEQYWARHKACWVSNGKTGCYGEDEERADPFEHPTGAPCSDPWCADKAGDEPASQPPAVEGSGTPEVDRD